MGTERLLQRIQACQNKSLFASIVKNLTWNDFFHNLPCAPPVLYDDLLLFLLQCAVNFSSDSIPNGIGFGGRVNHFGLFLSANFDRGHTFECTTFGSPCLAKTSQICPEVIECWGISTKGTKEERSDEALKGTVLERFKEDRHMLNMVGLANSSE